MPDRCPSSIIRCMRKCARSGPSTERTLPSASSHSRVSWGSWSGWPLNDMDRTSWRLLFTRSGVAQVARSARRRSGGRQRGGAVQQEAALTPVSRQRRGALELLLGLAETAQLGEEIAAHAGQQVVALQRRLGYQRVGQLE